MKHCQSVRQRKQNRLRQSVCYKVDHFLYMRQNVGQQGSAGKFASVNNYAIERSLLAH